MDHPFYGCPSLWRSLNGCLFPPLACLSMASCQRLLESCECDVWGDAVRPRCLVHIRNPPVLVQGLQTSHWRWRCPQTSAAVISSRAGFADGNLSPCLPNPTPAGIPQTNGQRRNFVRKLYTTGGPRGHQAIHLKLPPTQRKVQR
jgi:hypothetical protein